MRCTRDFRVTPKRWLQSLEIVENCINMNKINLTDVYFVSSVISVLLAVVAFVTVVFVLVWSVRHDAKVMEATENLCQIEDVEGKITVLPCTELKHDSNND